MSDPPGDHPLPHAELPAQNPLIFTVPEGAVLWTIGRRSSRLIYFSDSRHPAFLLMPSS